MKLSEIIKPFNIIAEARGKYKLDATDLKFTENRDDDDGNEYEYCEFRYDAPFRIGFDDYGDHGYYSLIDNRINMCVVDCTDDPAEVFARLPDFFRAVREWRDDGETYTEHANFRNYSDAVDWITKDKELVKAHEVAEVSFSIDGWSWEGNDRVSDENLDNYVEWSISDETISE